ncbi:MAG: DedA family protein, partial [Alphaproteobacteria bacterium]|nr:DedA family protein [Alphaproteobacteria bacterium]
MFESLRQAVIREADKPRATRALFVVAFMESSFFPIPPDALLAPMVLRRPHEWLKLAAICTLGSILGGILGYAIGYFLMDSVAGWVIDGYHLRAGVDKFQALFAEYGAAIILLKGLTPIPYKLVTIASGAAHYP